MTLHLSLSRTVIVAIIAALPACATPTGSKMTASEHVILGPKGYTVDWGPPMTGDYWGPDETKGDIKAASDACNAPPVCLFIITFRDRHGSATWVCTFPMKRRSNESHALSLGLKLCPR